MNVPLTPIRCLYRGVDLYGKKTGVVSGSARFTYAEFGERCVRELGYRPYRLLERLSPFDLAVLPTIESLHADAADPLDP